MVPIPEELASVLGGIFERPAGEGICCCFDCVRCLFASTFNDLSEVFISGRVIYRVVTGGTGILLAEREESGVFDSGEKSVGGNDSVVGISAG